MKRPIYGILFGLLIIGSSNAFAATVVDPKTATMVVDFEGFAAHDVYIISGHELLAKVNCPGDYSTVFARRRAFEDFREDAIRNGKMLRIVYRYICDSDKESDFVQIVP